MQRLAVEGTGGRFRCARTYACAVGAVAEAEVAREGGARGACGKDERSSVVARQHKLFGFGPVTEQLTPDPATGGTVR